MYIQSCFYWLWKTCYQSWKSLPACFFMCAVCMSDVRTGQVGCYLKRAIIFETKKHSQQLTDRICAEPVQAYFLMLSEWNRCPCARYYSIFSFNNYSFGVSIAIKMLYMHYGLLAFFFHNWCSCKVKYCLKLPGASLKMACLQSVF